VGSDSDIAILDRDVSFTVAQDRLRDNAGHPPYEARPVRGWPRTVPCRGRVGIDRGELSAERGNGIFHSQAVSEMAGRRRQMVPEMDPKEISGTTV
jgi:hypothetical protein